MQFWYTHPTLSNHKNHKAFRENPVSSEPTEPKDDTPDNEATVIRSTISGVGPGSNDVRLEYIEKIRNHQLNYEKYHVRSKIAEGGMGSIHKVFDKNLNRSSVLKIILPKIQEDPALFRQFIKEAQITARLEHPNIIPVHDIGIIDGDRLHFAMKEVHGDTLATILRHIKEGSEEYSNRFSYYSLLIVYRKICDAVAFAHSLGILHRDIKPDNIMVGGYGEVLLMDWGIAKLIGDEEMELPENFGAAFTTISNSEETLSGVVKGSPAFMSPEQAKGLGAEIDERSDVFLLGSTLYNIATLHAPYTGSDIEETIRNAQQGNLISSALRAPDRNIPRDLIRIIEKAMALNPAERYETVELLIRDIDALLEGNTTTTTKVFEAGETIIHEGDIGEEAYVISSGKVEVFKSTGNGDVHLLNLDSGQVIGEMALISQSVRSASIRAVERTELVMITKEVMEQGLSQLPPWLKTAVNCLTERLVHANQQVHPLVSGDCMYQVLRQLQYSYHSLGVSKEESQSDQATAANTQAVIGDIACSLCLPENKIECIVSGLLLQGLIRPVAKEEFTVANMSLLELLTQQAASEQSIHYTPTTQSSEMQDGKSLASIEQIIGSYSELDLADKLGEILSTLRGRLNSL
ncbi:MAG: hypothetical protein DHS20C12_27010 [Pseudohongiella sp.]|nr:MAG: hypothetical protein DHS20C12_27010 [Pseudohongiella sp.]